MNYDGLFNGEGETSRAILWPSLLLSVVGALITFKSSFLIGCILLLFLDSLFIPVAVLAIFDHGDVIARVAEVLGL